MAKKILHLILYKQWFDEILSGKKKFEYREMNPFWTKKLFDENNQPIPYEEIRFRNGYRKDARVMRVEFMGVIPEPQNNRYAIKLGRILEAIRCEMPQ